jgi:cysteine desulfurase/selenocysteine lyase
MTTDDRSFAPPHELAGQFGQVFDLGGGVVPGLQPTPLPGALGTASPGLAAAALAPGAPVSGPDDPRVLALAIERIAGELLSGPAGSSVAPVSVAPAAALTPSNVQLPGAPGTGAFLPSLPTAALPESGPAFVPSFPMTGAPGPGPAFVPSLPRVMPPVAGAPVALEASQAASSAGEPSPLAIAIERLASELFGGPARAPALPRPSPPVASHAPAPGLSGITPALAPWAPGAPEAGVPVPAPAHAPSSPFASIGALSMQDVLQLPLVDAGPLVDAAPYFLPAADAVGIESDRGVPRNLAYEIDAEPVLARNLGGAAFDPYTIRRDFPILEERVHGGKRLVWLDNAATTQKPRQVIDRLTYFYEHENSNIHRAAHVLAARATDAYEAGRESVRRFLHAGSTGEILFVRGATEGINLVAQSWGRRNVAAGDEIVLTQLEHHANIVPWQQLCAATGARLRIAPVDDRGDVILEAYERLLGPRTRLVAFPQVSNALGTVTPAREMIEIAHRHGALVLVDGAQAVSHMRVDVQALDCDFYVFSGHKVFAPTGIGAVFGKRAILEAMPPWQGGGNMIQDVTFERTTYQQPPWRFEAGTGSIGDAVALGAALDYVTRIGIDNVDRYEHELLAYAERQLATVPGLQIIGTPRNKAGVVSFVLDGQRTQDVGGALDKEGIAVRSGHHCAQPILRRFGVEATVRASFAFYNVFEDIDALVEALCRLQSGHY